MPSSSSFKHAHLLRQVKRSASPSPPLLDSTNTTDTPSISTSDSGNNALSSCTSASASLSSSSSNYTNAPAAASSPTSSRNLLNATSILGVEKIKETPTTLPSPQDTPSVTSDSPPGSALSTAPSGSLNVLPAPNSFQASTGEHVSDTTVNNDVSLLTTLTPSDTTLPSSHSVFPEVPSSIHSLISSTAQSPSIATNLSPTVLSIPVTIANPSTTYQSISLLTGSVLITSATPVANNSTNSVNSHTSSSKTPAIVGGVIAGVVGLALLCLLGIYCIRKRHQAAEIEWESVQREIHSARLPIQTPPPQLPEIIYSSPSRASNHSTTNTSSLYGQSARPMNPILQTPYMSQNNAISPRLMVNVPPISTQGSFGNSPDGLSAGADPFADAYAVMRARPRFSPNTPTIRVSEASTITDVTQMYSSEYSDVGTALKDAEMPRVTESPFLDVYAVPASFDTSTGKRSKMSSGSGTRTGNASSTSDSAYAGLAL